MSRPVLVVGALGFAFALAGCAGVAPTTPSEMSLTGGAEAPVQASHGEGPFRVEWSVEGPGRIGGRIYNDYQAGASGFRLLVQGLAAFNQVMNRSYVWVGGDIGPLDSRSFLPTDVPPASHYWITVHSYQLQE